MAVKSRLQLLEEWLKMTDDRAELFSVGADDNSKDKATSCQMATKKPFFSRRVKQHGNWLLQVSCGISVLGVFEIQPKKSYR